MAPRAPVLVQVFARAPLIGRVKTRLAAQIGRRRTMRIYRALLARTLHTAAEAGIAAEIWVAGPSGHPHLRALAASRGMVLRVQRGAGLGERMWRALRDGLARACAVIIIGTDCPGLTAAHLDRARAALTDRDQVALGPSTDGGYYLIAARRAPRALFRGVEWGTDRVLIQTRRRLRRLGLTEHVLEELTDIDDRGALRQLRQDAIPFAVPGAAGLCER